MVTTVARTRTYLAFGAILAVLTTSIATQCEADGPPRQSNGRSTEVDREAQQTLVVCKPNDWRLICPQD